MNIIDTLIANGKVVILTAEDYDTLCKQIEELQQMTICYHQTELKKTKAQLDICLKYIHGMANKSYGYYDNYSDIQNARNILTEIKELESK